MTPILSSRSQYREIEKFIIRQKPIGAKDDYDSETSWISAAEEGGEAMGGGKGESG